MKIEAYIGIGSNLEQPLAQVQAAVKAMEALDQSNLIALSPLYRTAPVGPQDQPDYINAAAHLQTSLSAHQLLHALQEIEQQQGRIRAERWGARTLDLDLLVYGNGVIEDEALQVPHPRIAERAFVLHPLFDIAADLLIPGFGPVRDLMSGVKDQVIEKLDSSIAP